MLVDAIIILLVIALFVCCVISLVRQARHGACSCPYDAECHHDGECPIAGKMLADIKDAIRTQEHASSGDETEDDDTQAKGMENG